MTTHRRPRLRRLEMLLPVVLLAVAGAAALTPALTPAHTATPQLASFQDGSPIGVLGHTYPVPGGLHVKGWDFDPDQRKAAVRTYARVDGRWINSIVDANRNRPDVAALHPVAGAAHGYSWTVPVPEGTHKVCIVAANLATHGANTVLGCVRKTFDYGPVGHVDSVKAAPGAVRVTGWSFDADSPTAPVTMSVRLDGMAHSVVANQSRPDVAAAHPSAGAAHGFDTTIPAAQGTHRVCVIAGNIGIGSNNSLGCTAVTLRESPVGQLDTAAEKNGKLHLRGWAFDPDARTSPLQVSVRVDFVAPVSLVADDPRPDVATTYPRAGSDHGFHALLDVGEGTHRVCVTARNVSYGSDTRLACRNVTLDFTPAAALTKLSADPTGLTATGWAYDPDTSAPIDARVSVDGEPVKSVVAHLQGTTHNTHRGHRFSAFLPLTSGPHTVCVTGLNVDYGTHDSPASCRTTTLALSPVGKFQTLTRATGGVQVTGWALDPDRTGPVSVAVTLDDAAAGTVVANVDNPAVNASYPRFGSTHGFSAMLTTDDGEHTVCLTALNVGGGQNRSLGCKLIIAVHPVAPSAPRSVTAVAGFGGAAVTWKAPTSDGGAPLSSYTVTAQPGGAHTTVAGSTRVANVFGLKPKRKYTLSVVGTNVAGRSVGTVSSRVTTPAGPPAQRTPAPVSTSRYIRNISGSSAANLATMRAEGAADARSNPSGHGYLVLLDIGGQDRYDGGVVLSATTRFVSYADLVRNVEAYLDGYHSTQRPSAPVMVALGTNNDMDVSATTGAIWASSVVNPVLRYASRYLNISVAGANDIEPGFRSTYRQTKAWLGGYLATSRAPFVFNGSADGCAWTRTNGSCNNGWKMAGLQYLAAGAAPTRMLNLPQIYNTTMAEQWKYISLTGIVNGSVRINFAGTLTEVTACRQAGGCGSMSAHGAWTRLWTDLQSDSRLAVSSLPYSTDLRIDR